MQTKTYFASSVPAALDVARKELGPDAMLVRSRPSSAEVRELGRLEVTFAFEEKARVSVSASAPVSAPVPHQALAGPRHSPTELDDLRRQIAALRDAVGKSGPLFGDFLQTAGGEIERKVDAAGHVVARLCSSGLSREFARDLVGAVSRHPGEPETSLVAELTGRLPVKPFEEMKPGESRTLAFIGPAGRGKTTSLVKVAVGYGIARRVPVRIYSAGEHGVGGQEQLARFAAILGVPFHAFESLDSLHLALNGDGSRGLILIDTPGMSRADSREMSEFSGFFARRPEIEKHLVLRADSRTADLMHSVSAFAALGPSRLLFTGIDEALTLGAMVEVLAQSGMPAAFVGTGQQIPDDMDNANAAAWARTVCGGNALAAPLGRTVAA